MVYLLIAWWIFPWQNVSSPEDNVLNTVIQDKVGSGCWEPSLQQHDIDMGFQALTKHHQPLVEAGGLDK